MSSGKASFDEIILAFLKKFFDKKGDYPTDDLNKELAELFFDIQVTGYQTISQAANHSKFVDDKNLPNGRKLVTKQKEKKRQQNHEKLKENAEEHVKLMKKLSDLKIEKDNDVSLAKHTEKIIKCFQEKEGYDEDKLDWLEAFQQDMKKDEDNSDKKKSRLENLHRSIETICWAIEPYRHHLIVREEKVTSQFNKLKTGAAEHGNKNWDGWTAGKVESVIDEIFDSKDLNNAEKRELLRRVYPVPKIPDEYNKQQEAMHDDQYKTVRKDMKERKKVCYGALAKWHFILNSGYDTSEGAIKKRREWAHSGMGTPGDIETVVELQEQLKEQVAEELLKTLKNTYRGKGAVDQKIGPLKKLEGIMKKADRKLLGKDKESAYDWLPFQEKPKPFRSLTTDIKDIIRGTMTFESYDAMMRCLADMTKTFLDPKSNICQQFGIVGVSKVQNGFTPVDDLKINDLIFGVRGDKTYRDMKIIVNLDPDMVRKISKQEKKLLEAYHKSTNYAPFEIQLNTVNGIIIKNAGNGLYSDYEQGLYNRAKDETKDETKDDADDATTDYCAKELKMFNVDKFVNDKIVGIEGKAATIVKKRYDSSMIKLKALEPPHEICCKKVKGKGKVYAMKKAHQVYKMDGGLAKDACNAVLSRVYEIGFWADGYHPGYPEGVPKENEKEGFEKKSFYAGTHCQEFFTAFDSLVDDLQLHYVKKMKKASKVDTDLRIEARSRIENFLTIVDGVAAPFDGQKQDLIKYAEESPRKAKVLSIDIYRNGGQREPRQRKQNIRKVNPIHPSPPPHAGVGKSNVGDYSMFAKKQDRKGALSKLKIKRRIMSGRTSNNSEEDIWC